MKCFLKLGYKVTYKALTVTMLLGAFMVFMGGWACAEEKSAMEEFLDIIEARIHSGQTGAAWQRAAFEMREQNRFELMAAYCERQRSGAPAHEWEL